MNHTVARLFPQGIPRLWCPLLTHFEAPATPDADRIHRHMAEIAPSVKGLLVPGSTGEGWDMSDTDILSLLEIVLDQARELGQRVLIGALKPTAAETVASIETVARRLSELAGQQDPGEAMEALGVAGFTICPPTGVALSQDELHSGVKEVLAVGLPTALYQLPQVTQNEIEPDRVATLAADHPNLFLFKDTSGNDRVAEAGLDYGDLFLVRGAEGRYSRWVKAGGGPYDGLLLSTANSFSAELGAIFDHLDEGDASKAHEISERIEACVEAMFPEAGEVPAGNAFANANKVFDHLRAFGPEAESCPTPMLYGGYRIPIDLIRSGRRILESNGFDVSSGYLQGREG